MQRQNTGSHVIVECVCVEVKMKYIFFFAPTQKGKGEQSQDPIVPSWYFPNVFGFCIIFLRNLSTVVFFLVLSLHISFIQSVRFRLVFTKCEYMHSHSFTHTKYTI